uniref:Uncharacterized protein n=1 Tax=Panagrolaimus sp. JU765 TaxID=591449 RepID=A0AC34Q401_9BILA
MMNLTILFTIVVVVFQCYADVRITGEGEYELRVPKDGFIMKGCFQRHRGSMHFCYGEDHSLTKKAYFCPEKLCGIDLDYEEFRKHSYWQKHFSSNQKSYFAQINGICFEIKIGPTHFKPEGKDKLGQCFWNRQVIGKLSVEIDYFYDLTLDLSGVIIGVVAGIGALAAIIIIPVAIYCYLKKKGNTEQDKKPEQEVSKKVSTPVDNNRDVVFYVG